VAAKPRERLPHGAACARAQEARDRRTPCALLVRGRRHCAPRAAQRACPARARELSLGPLAQHRVERRRLVVGAELSHRAARAFLRARGEDLRALRAAFIPTAIAIAAPSVQQCDRMWFVSLSLSDPAYGVGGARAGAGAAARAGVLRGHRRRDQLLP